MSIRFKFRSSVNFDSVDIDGRPSISVRDLRSKIIRQKNLNICQDFDLVFSDALTSLEYDDDNFEILSGSSVIIKRIPSGTQQSVVTPSNTIEDMSMRNSRNFNPPVGLKQQMEDFEVFGIDFCPVQASLSESNFEVDGNFLSDQRENAGHSSLYSQKLETSDLSEAVPKEGKISQEVRFQEQLDRTKIGLPTVQNIDLPSELKCSICKSIFKEAVMLPCCQHSFCEKCIHPFLLEKTRCPKCSSSKCRVEDLLPNLSLRQAIEHFLEFQMSLPSSNDVHKYAPDGESGIQAIDFSCAVTTVQREACLPCSPAATEKGSNQIISEPYHESLVERNPVSGTPVLCNAKLAVTNSQWVSPNHFNTRVPDEADSTFKRRKSFQIDVGVADRHHVANGGRKRGERACYMCGSTDHLIRDCPIASSPHPMSQSGNGFYPGNVPVFMSSYWNGNMYSFTRPFANFYNNAGIVPFNATMTPVMPFGHTPYVSSMYGSLPSTGGMMRMGSMLPPITASTEQFFSPSEFFENRDVEKKKKFSSQIFSREQYCDTISNGDDDCKWQKDGGYNENGRMNEYESHREHYASDPKDNFTQRSGRKHLNDRDIDHDVYLLNDRREKSSHSNSGRGRTSCDSERESHFDRHCEERHKHHLRDSKILHGPKGQCIFDSGSHQERKNEYDRRILKSVAKEFQAHHSYEVSVSEPNSSSIVEVKKWRERDSSHSSRNSKHNKKLGEDLATGKWQMNGLDEQHREHYEHRKRRREH